jgi:hypothetical protein
MRLNVFSHPIEKVLDVFMDCIKKHTLDFCICIMMMCLNKNFILWSFAAIPCKSQIFFSYLTTDAM